MEYTVDEVYGLSRNIPLNYVERHDVDERLRCNLNRDKHITIFGSSKQGKTCLRKHCLNENDYILVQCSNRWSLSDLNANILKRAGYELTESTNVTYEGKAKVSASVKILDATLGGEAGGGATKNVTHAAQNKEVDASLHRCNDTVEARIKETYCWLLTPEIDCFVDMKTIQWDASRISGGTDSIVAKASRKMQQSETLITKWAPALLLMELNNVLWKDTDCIQIKKLWEYLCTYCYLPRLAKYSVLEDAIRTGLNSQEYFALAAGYTGDRYVELRYNQFVDCINTSDLLVKLDPARKQLLAEKSAPAVVVQPAQTGQGGEQPTLFNLPPDAPIDPTVTLHQPPTAQPATVPAPPKNTRFYMTAELDTTRINRDVQRLVEEVITHLLSADGCKVSVTLDVTADAPDGLSTPIVRTVMENCKTLKVKDFGVDE